MRQSEDLTSSRNRQAETIDTQVVRTIGYDGATMTWYLILTVAIVGVSIWAIVNSAQLPKPHLVLLAGWTAAMGFGVLGAIGASRLLLQRGPVVTISPAGIRDTQFSFETIAWADIAAVSQWTMNGRHATKLTLLASRGGTVKRVPVARLARNMDVGLGTDGFLVPASGLLVTHNDLRSWIEAYAATYSGQKVFRSNKLT